MWHVSLKYKVVDLLQKIKARGIGQVKLYRITKTHIFIIFLLTRAT